MTLSTLPSHTVEVCVIGKAATQRAAATLTRTHTITHTLLYQHTHKRSLQKYMH